MSTTIDADVNQLLARYPYDPGYGQRYWSKEGLDPRLLCTIADDEMRRVVAENYCKLPARHKAPDESQ